MSQVNTASTQSDQQTWAAVYRYVNDCFAQGMPDAQVVSALEAQGWDAVTARSVVSQARVAADAEAADQASALQQPYTPDYSSPRMQRAARNAAKGEGVGAMWFGGAVCALGVLVTLVTMLAGDTVVVAWGAVVFGGLTFFKGLAAYSGNKS